MYGSAEFFKRGRELADEVAANAAVEEFLYAGDGGGGGQLRVDGEIAEFVFEEGEAVGGVGGLELGEKGEDEGGFAGAEEAGEDSDWNGGGRKGGVGEYHFGGVVRFVNLWFGGVLRSDVVVVRGGRELGWIQAISVEE